MSFPSLNYDVRSTSNGLRIEAFRLGGLDTAAPSVIDSNQSGLVTGSVLDTVAGVLTLQFTAPFPTRVVACIPHLSAESTVLDANSIARCSPDSYDNVTGTLDIFLSTDDDSGNPVVATLSSTHELHCILALTYEGH